MKKKSSKRSKDASKIAGKGASSAPPPYQRIYLVLNPAAGGDEPVINTINDVFHPLGIQWEVDVTHKYGDAQELARKAAEAGYDLVAGYGGDGTQHEIANGLIGTDVTMGVLPGGTGNGFCREMGLPNKLRPALEILATSHRVKNIDVVEFEDQYFIQRLYVGIEPEEQTSREMKDKYGTLAYAVTVKERLKKKDIHNNLKKAYPRHFTIAFSTFVDFWKKQSFCKIKQ